MITITSVMITKTKNSKRQVADVEIIIDHSLLISNIKLINNGSKLFVDFSHTARKNSNIRSPDVVPLNSDVRQYIEREIISEYYRTEEVEE